MTEDVYTAARERGYRAAEARALARIADAARASADADGAEVEVAMRGAHLEVDSIRLALYEVARMDVTDRAGPVGATLSGTAPGKRKWQIRFLP